MHIRLYWVCGHEGLEILDPVSNQSIYEEV